MMINLNYAFFPLKEKHSAFWGQCSPEFKQQGVEFLPSNGPKSKSMGLLPVFFKWSIWCPISFSFFHMRKIVNGVEGLQTSALSSARSKQLDRKDPVSARQVSLFQQDNQEPEG